MLIIDVTIVVLVYELQRECFCMVLLALERLLWLNYVPVMLVWNFSAWMDLKLLVSFLEKVRKLCTKFLSQQAKQHLQWLDFFTPKCLISLSILWFILRDYCCRGWNTGGNSAEVRVLNHKKKKRKSVEHINFTWITVFCYLCVL